MDMKKAINNFTGIILVKDNKVVAKMKPWSIRDGVISVVFEGDARDHINIPVKNREYYVIRYSTYTGEYLDDNFIEDDEEMLDYFENTRVCNEFELRWGMVPDSFKDVEGYRKAIEE